MTAAMKQPEPRPADSDSSLEIVQLTQVEAPNVEVRSSTRTSMKNLGQRVAVKLRQRAPKREGAPPRFEIIDGKHRIAAAINLGWTTIRAEVEMIGRTAKDRCDRAKETLVANAVRERNLGAEAEAVAILLATRLTAEDISKDTGVPLRMVKELEAMKKGLVPEVFKKVKTGEIARGAALKMLKLDEVRQRDLIEGVSEGKEVSVTDAEEAVRDQRNDMLDKLDKVRPQGAESHTALGQAVQMVSGMYTGKNKEALLDAAAILRGERK